MISIAEDNEFTVLIADLIETLAGTTKFTLLVWINGTEIPFEFGQHCEFYFMQEGFRVSHDNVIEYIFYDNIATVRLIYES